MILKVNKDICEIKQNEVWNVGDYNVHTVQVELSEEFNGLVNKVRYFVEDNSYDMLITDNIAEVPREATLAEGIIKIGVYGYDADTDILVQSTSPVNKYITSGTYTGDPDNTQPLTPTDKQQMESAIQKNADDIIVLQNNKQDVLISGENIKTINNESILGSGNIEIGGGGGGTSNYNALTNKPKINNVELKGNKSLSDLGIQPAGNYATMNDLTEESRAILNEIETTYYNKNQTNNLLNNKQNTLISGQNIKTINNASILGSGNIDIEGGGASDELIGALPQTIPTLSGSYYVLSETNATITTDSGGGTPDSITKDITPSSPNVTVDGDEFTSTAAGGWQLVANIANLLTDGETYCYRAANVEGKPFLKYGGLRIGYEQNGSQYINLSVMSGGNIVNPTGTFTYDASNGGAYFVVGGASGGTIKFQLYQGTTPPEEGGSSEYITIELTANVKYPMDNYKGQTFYSNSTVNLYKIGEGGSTYVLPIATSTTLGGVKAVSKTLNMTEAVGVDEFGQLFVVPNPVETLPLAGKNVLFIGDSLTYGNMGTDPETGGQLYPDENYPEYFADVTGCTVYNKGVSGASATSYLNNVYSTIDFTIDYDLILIMLGTNLSLQTTQGEDYRTIIENLFRDTEGAARIFLITPPYNNMTSTGHATYAKNANPVVKEVGQEYCLPVIDTYYESGLNSSNGDLARPIDDLHFNDWGYQRLANFIANQVLSKWWLPF